MRETLMVTVMMAACAAGVVGGEQHELPEVVVTATGQEKPIMRLGHSISTITAEQIEANRWRTLPEALRTVPGLHILQHGAPGSTVGISIRGSRTSHVLVLVDGVRLNDPSSPTREPDISAIDLANVERIEIVRGPQSGLYGSDAIAGVIHVITRRAEAAFAASAFAEGGSYNTYRVGGQLESASGRATGRANVSYLKTDGFSSANARLPGNEEADGLEAWNASVALGYQATEWLKFSGRLQFMDAEADYDAGGGPHADADNTVQIEQVLTGVQAEIGTAEAAWKQTVGLNHSTFERVFNDRFGVMPYEGETLEADWRHDMRLNAAHQLTTGLNYREEKAESAKDTKASAGTLGLYLQDAMQYGAFDAVVGLRYDRHDEFGDELTWRAAPSYRFESIGTRLKASVGTGLKAPSLFQLYAPASQWGPVGNPALDPETSLGWDAGIEQALLAETLVLGLTYFGSRVDDQIDFIVGYQNVSEVESEGVEVSVSWTPVAAFNLLTTYTRTSAEDKGTGAPLIRTPKDRATLTAGAALGKRLHVSTTVLYVGAFDDRYFDAAMFMPVDTRVSSAVVVNMAATMALSERFELFGRIDNLFDENYEEVYGYGTAGLSGYGGVKVNW